MDCDFGKLAILICFDANFPSVWDEAARQGAELVIWPSAYGAGTQLAAHALNHHCPIDRASQPVLDAWEAIPTTTRANKTAASFDAAKSERVRQNMLIGIPRLMSPQLMRILMEMGHGDELVIADANFPSHAIARGGTPCEVVHGEGAGVVEWLDALLGLLPLD